MHGTDREVVGMSGQVVPDVRFPAAVVGQLHAEPDRHALRPPTFRRATDDPLPIGERRIAEGLRSGLEVHVIGDRQFPDAPLQSCLGVDIDGGVAVRRQVRMQVRVERQVARLAIGHGGAQARMMATLTPR